ncbi:hypothetical protein FSB08_10745 [Paraburkholderia sp. JPY432]|nr:hypothetical protein [Paraburkholderia youngii]
MMKNEWRKLLRLYIKAYLSLAGIVAAFLGVSIVQGAGWRPALAGMPLYVTLFIAISFKLIRDIFKLKRLGSQRQDEG